MRSRILIARDTLSVSCSHPDAAVDPSESACPPKLRTLSSLFPVPSRLLLLLPPVDAVVVACGCPASSEETLRRRLLCAAATAIGCRNGLYMYQSPRRRLSRARMQHIMRGRYLARAWPVWTHAEGRSPSAGKDEKKVYFGPTRRPQSGPFVEPAEWGVAPAPCSQSLSLRFPAKQPPLTHRHSKSSMTRPALRTPSRCK